MSIFEVLAGAPPNDDEWQAQQEQLERGDERHHRALERQAAAWFAGELAEDPAESYNEYADPSYLAESAPAVTRKPGRQQGELFDPAEYKVA